MKTCKKCNGTGEIIVPVEEHLGRVMYGNEQCDECNGTGEVRTNFDRITASPEALAEFIYCLIEGCDYYAGNGARKISQYATEDTEDKFHIELIHGNRDFGELLDWLNEECKE